MKCINCDNESFTEKRVRLSPELKGKVLEVVSPAFVCNHCKEPLMNSKQMNALLKAIDESKYDISRHDPPKCDESRRH